MTNLINCNKSFNIFINCGLSNNKNIKPRNIKKSKSDSFFKTNFNKSTCYWI